MRVHYLQHVAFEGLGAIQPWLFTEGHTISGTRLDRNEPLPEVGDFDWLIVMGGPMGVNDDQRLPWLTAEKALIRRSIDAGKRVLGVCLGAQLIASALGARVYPNSFREIGWFPVDQVAQAASHPFGMLFPERMDAFHWHGDTFDLPAGATWLARSEACAHQAFAWGNHVLALQFHLETTFEGATLLIDNCGDELVAAPYVQPRDELVANPARFEHLQQSLSRFLQTLAG